MTANPAANTKTRLAARLREIFANERRSKAEALKRLGELDEGTAAAYLTLTDEELEDVMRETRGGYC